MKSKVRQSTEGTRSTAAAATLEAEPVARVRPRAAAVPPRAPASRAVPSFRALSFSGGLESVVKNDPILNARVRELASAVTFTVYPKTRSGKVVHEYRSSLKEHPTSDFRPDESAVSSAVRRLERLGFEVLHAGRFGVTARGPARLVSEVSKTSLEVAAMPDERSSRALASFPHSDAGIAPQPSRLFIAPRESLAVAPKISEAIDHFIFTPPPIYFGTNPSATAPTPTYHHLNPGAIRRLLQVPDGAPSGEGISVAVIDSGFYPHPYYKDFSITRVSVPGSPPPGQDENGHGTAITLNVLSIAPKVDLLGIPQTDPPEISLEVAFYDRHAKVITCSWGWNYEQAHTGVELMIRDIVQDGGIVLFASGNGHYAWPGSMPEVISVGGVYADVQDQLQASNYASGYMSSRYPNRRVPDFCGLCGQIPNAMYIPMPTQPKSEMDRSLGGKTTAGLDGTTKSDGWCVASGTSSATPQVAGVAAILLATAQAKGKSLSNPQLRKILEQTAVPVQTGNNALGFPATGHPNVAVGYGLVNAGAALAQV